MDNHADYWNYKTSTEVISRIVEIARQKWASDTEVLYVQGLCLGEEVGEAISELRSYLGGSARKSGNLDKLCEELVDGYIVTQVIFEILKEDFGKHLYRKYLKISERGGI